MLKEYPGTEVQTGTRISERGDEEQDRPGRWLDVAGGAAENGSEKGVEMMAVDSSGPPISQTSSHVWAYWAVGNEIPGVATIHALASTHPAQTLLR
ncbi:hypothetical protein NQZ68_028759 [Dissostichus eleginoides]|nr:hypothetical protein NQZ68_028759 [Dissostichus eleginoides]